ncbi:hypothetical protein C8Q78DRAFT_998830 [Trametes maxima]|nr:hypothetical protein C8Q78DRAFT_998830 [Trametes maxima]
MAANINDNWVQRSGQFIGSSGMTFADQTAADIYYNNYFRTQGFNHRIAVICVSWGMSMLYIQEGTQAQEQWAPQGPMLNTVDVQDNGVHPAIGHANIPQVNRLTLAGSPAAHVINGQVTVGSSLPWHRRITVIRVGHHPMHYHQHQSRKGHEPFIVPPIRRDNRAAHWTMRSLSFGTQVSNYRSAGL